MPQHRKKDYTAKAYLSLSVYLYLLVYSMTSGHLRSSYVDIFRKILNISFFTEHCKKLITILLEFFPLGQRGLKTDVEDPDPIESLGI